MSSIVENLTALRAGVAEAARRAGRDPAGIRLVAVSKTHPAEAVREAMAAGQSVFGESRVQEAARKIPQLPAGLEWHFIGHLQRNKVRAALPLFHLFHGVDSLALGAAVDRVAAETGRRVAVLLEVNVSGESSKRGLAPDELRRAFDGFLRLPQLEVRGLMTMAPWSEDPQAARPVFRALRLLRDELATGSGHPLPELSMGMSGDYPAAIAEGATLIRPGTVIFGTRSNP